MFLTALEISTFLIEKLDHLPIMNLWFDDREILFSFVELINLRRLIRSEPHFFSANEQKKLNKCVCVLTGQNG